MAVPIRSSWFKRGMPTEISFHISLFPINMRRHVLFIRPRRKPKSRAIWWCSVSSLSKKGEICRANPPSRISDLYFYLRLMMQSRGTSRKISDGSYVNDSSALLFLMEFHFFLHCLPSSPLCHPSIPQPSRVFSVQISFNPQMPLVCWESLSDRIKINHEDRTNRWILNH